MFQGDKSHIINCSKQECASRLYRPQLNFLIILFRTLHSPSLLELGPAPVFMVIHVIISKLIEVILIRQELILLHLLFWHFLFTALILWRRLLCDLNFPLLALIFLRVFFELFN